jgi:hypothetical protein
MRALEPGPVEEPPDFRRLGLLDDAKQTSLRRQAASRRHDIQFAGRVLAETGDVSS